MLPPCLDNLTVTQFNCIEWRVSCLGPSYKENHTVSLGYSLNITSNTVMELVPLGHDLFSRMWRHHYKAIRRKLIELF